MSLNFTKEIIYKPFLYKNEEEIMVWGVELTKDFWNSEDIGNKYLQLLQIKLEQILVKDIWGHISEPDIQMAIITYYTDINTLKKEAIRPILIGIRDYEKGILDNISHYMKEDYEKFETISLIPSSIANFLVHESIAFKKVAHEFANRLKIVQLDSNAQNENFNSKEINKDKANSVNIYPSFFSYLINYSSIPKPIRLVRDLKTPPQYK